MNISDIIVYAVIFGLALGFLGWYAGLGAIAGFSLGRLTYFYIHRKRAKQHPISTGNR